MAGCATATPMPITTVAANRLIVSKARLRVAEPSAVSRRPAVAAAITPMRATRREPANDATAKMTMGVPLNAPISVPVRPNSSRSAGIAGGTARIARRSATPISQRRASESGQVRDDVTEFSRKTHDHTYQSMIRKSGHRFSEEIMLYPRSRARRQFKLKPARSRRRLANAQAPRRVSPCAPVPRRASRARPRRPPRARA